MGQEGEGGGGITARVFGGLVCCVCVCVCACVRACLPSCDPPINPSWSILYPFTHPRTAHAPSTNHTAVA
jgi:hypothetical protein